MGRQHKKRAPQGKGEKPVALSICSSVVEVPRANEVKIALTQYVVNLSSANELRYAFVFFKLIPGAIVFPACFGSFNPDKPSN